MRILFLAHRVPYPPNKGDKIRSYHECRYLSERHEVWLACLADDPTDLGYVEVLSRDCRAVTCELIGRGSARRRALARLVRGGPMSVAYFHNPRLAATVSRWLATERFDVVLAFSSQMAQYVWPPDPPPERREPSGPLRQPPRVMDLVDVDSEKFRAYGERAPRRAGRQKPTPAKRPPTRWVYAAEARRLARYETEIARRFDLVILVSEAEREVFERVTGSHRSRGSAARHGPSEPDGLRPLAVPNGVDVDYFTLGDERPWPYTMVFAGAMDYAPNIDAVTWLVHDVLPRVRSRIVDAGGSDRVRLRIVGASPTRAVRRLARVDGVEVLGTVPDIRPYVRTAAVSLAPMRIARGIQNKVLEAMAMGVPVVTTAAGLEGLACRPGEDLLVADDADGMAEATVRVLTERPLAQQLSERGRAYTCARHAWERSMETLEAALGEVAERASGGPRPARKKRAGTQESESGVHSSGR